MHKINVLLRPFWIGLVGILCATNFSAVKAQSDLNLQTSELQWQLKRDRRGIKVYTAAVSGSKYRAIRSNTIIKASLNSIIALIKDSSACSKWAAMCSYSEVYSTVSETENYIYSYNNLPFPIKDRDILAHVHWKIDSQAGNVSMVSTATNGLKEENSKAIRLTNAVAQWQFTKQTDGSVRVENIAHVDPNGPIPAWISNRLMISSPYKSLLKMRQLAESGDYNNLPAPLPGL